MKSRRPYGLTDQPFAVAAMGGQLKAARLEKGLSQRDLGKRAGLPQSHISQIENGGTDLRLTSLLSLAHALDLEVVLAPRQLLPAIENLQRGSAIQTSLLYSGTALRTRHDLAALERITARLITQFEEAGIQGAEELASLRQILRELTLIHLSPSQAKGVQERTKHLKTPLDTLKDLVELKTDVGAAANYRSSMRDTLGTINPIARDLRDLRNRFVHEAPVRRNEQVPAYRLDEEDGGA